ncbi:MAG: 3TM-type holin [Spongiibacter sp.]|nr:3TM-type holin [Spongiibacter sp.]
MAIVQWLGGLLKGGKDLAEVFTENKEQQGERRHEEVMADFERDQSAIKQFAAEFHQRQHRTRWDAFVDGLNRLPRPLVAIAVLSLFVLAPVNPERFLLIAKSYEMMPPGYWALLSVVISFYFGGRMQLKAQDMAVKKDAVQAAKELVEMRRSFRELDDPQADEGSRIYEGAVDAGVPLPENKVVKEWLAKARTNS